MSGKKTILSESEIIEKAKSDPRAFGLLYEKYYEQIFRFVYSRIQKKDQSADIVSQVFMKALKNIQKYEDRGYSISSWFYRIAINECNLFFRQSKKVIEVGLNGNELHNLHDEIGEEDEKIDNQILLKALNKLDVKDSNLIEMRFFEGRKFKEIALILGITEANSKMKLYRILKKMKSDITKH